MPLSSNARISITRKLLQIEHNSHLLGWHTPPTLHVLSIENGRLHSRMLGEASQNLLGVKLPDLQHYQAFNPHDLNITGRPVAVAAALHICHGCINATDPTGHRRMVTAVDLDRTPYLVERNGFQISSLHSTVPIFDTPGRFHTAMTSLLHRWHQQTRATTASAEIDETARCRTPECGGDPDDGEGWDGFCGNCADRNYASGT